MWRGSLFFTISSFFYCYAEELGRLKPALTKWGYVGGKINFIICTYLMCIETINLTADHDNREQKKRKLGLSCAGVSRVNANMLGSEIL
eukprot:Skav220313  [mRNA]  locus=scaffold525:93816:95826:+ [translate_table: standard]